MMVVVMLVVMEAISWVSLEAISLVWLERVAFLPKETSLMEVVEADLLLVQEMDPLFEAVMLGDLIVQRGRWKPSGEDSQAIGVVTQSCFAQDSPCQVESSS
jgi:hypothetical protein